MIRDTFRRWLFKQVITEQHEQMRKAIPEKAWIITGNTGTILDLTCAYCGIAYHANSGKHKKGCPYRN